MENRNIFQELAGYRVKVEKDGREVVNIPGILCLPGLLAAPRMGIVGMIAAPLLGMSVHLENDNGKAMDLEAEVKKAVETFAQTAKETARTIQEEIDKAWDAVSADDPEPDEDPETEKAEASPAQEDQSGRDPGVNPENCETDGDVPEIRVNPDDSGEA